MLKDQVQQYNIAGDTPLDPAMQQALTLLNHAHAGSRTIIVTDGDPQPASINGVNQSDDIRQHLIGSILFAWRASQHIRTGPGLVTTRWTRGFYSSKRYCRGTGGTATNVRNAQDLAQVVVHLYADWQHLAFVPAQASGDTHNILIDTYAKRVTFVTFRNSAISCNYAKKVPILSHS